MPAIKLTKAEQVIVDELLRLIYIRWVPSRRCIAVEIVGGWSARTHAQRKALWRLSERGLLEVATTPSWEYRIGSAKLGEAYYVHDFLPAFWEYVNKDPKQMQLDALQREINRLNNDTYNERVGNVYPQWPLSQWEVKSMQEAWRHHGLGDLTAEEAWWEKWRRVAQNKALTEQDIQALEQEISAIENCATVPFTIGSALWD